MAHSGSQIKLEFFSGVDQTCHGVSQRYERVKETFAFFWSTDMITQAKPGLELLPSPRQLKLLALRSLVGLAARSVERARSRYASVRLECVHAIDDTIRAAAAFSRGQQVALPWREVKRAVLYAQDANAESVAIAAEHLASAVANAHAAEKTPSSCRYVLQQAHLAIESAHDACFDQEYVETTCEDFFRLQKLSKQHRFPSLGPTMDVGPNGPLGPVWPIWERVRV